MKRFNLWKLNDGEVKEHCQVKISNRFAALENLDDIVDNKRAWECTGENTKLHQKSLGQGSQTCGPPVHFMWPSH
jgi:hypothetical protein